MDGGWGIDALLGEVTRPHADLDLALPRGALEDAEATLDKLGFARDKSADPGLPARLVLRNEAGRLVDFHPLVFDEHGNGWQALGEDAWGMYPADGLAATGTIAGVSVRCLAPDLQLRHHLGWSWAPQNRGDLERLAERYGLPLPPG